MVPTAAIQRNAQGAFVYVVKPDQTVAMRTVSVSTTDGNVAAAISLYSMTFLLMRNLGVLSRRTP